MSTDSKKTDWAKGRWKEMLIEQRKFMWREDTLDMLAAWLGLRHGMTAVDVGCGLGYLGYTYWPYFGEDGHYIGVDVSSNLVKDATEAAKEWAVGGEASFVAGDAYNLPFPDDSADLVMCQVVLMHLEKPELALAEMVRVAKPGGLVMCKEPDNMSQMLAMQYNSLPELDMDDKILSMKMTLIGNKGRNKLPGRQIFTM